jgi:hypothetical protein
MISFYANVQSQQANSEISPAKSLTNEANKMADLYKSGDYKRYIKFILPVYIKAVGGEERMIGILNSQATQLQNANSYINRIFFTEQSEILTVKNELQCTVLQNAELKSDKARVITHSTLIAISTDNGKTWEFMDTSNVDESVIRKLLPNLSPSIIIPAKQKPTVFKE